MPPLQLTSFIFPSPTAVKISQVLNIRSSPSDSQPEGLIVLGVCLGVAVALVFLWYTCGRAHVGPLKEIQMIRRGTKMRKEVRTVHVQPVPPPSPETMSGRHRGGPYSTSSTESSSSGDDTPPATSTSDPYTTPAAAPSEATAEAELREPPAAYTNHAMNYLDPMIGVAADGVAEPDPRATLRHVPGGLDSIATPLGRQAVTSLPLPVYRTNVGVQVQGGGTAYRPPPTHVNVKVSENNASNWWDA
ncbi:uncharacterized protein P884DRAFT_73895 [Thermothelomyces heterothallicus CBS 202.75]|uniref:uncharacterized protein n=1 Tax=Thermothelomyces heterothallicus CBS 202.75 TaxID=1149848 RepID=UPI003741F318